MSLTEIISIGEVLKEMRKKRNISQVEMAEILGIGQSTYANYERNNRMPSDKVFKKIEDVFEISTKELIFKAIAPKSSDDIFKTLANYYEDLGFETSYLLGPSNHIKSLYIRNTSDESRLTVTKDVAKSILDKLGLVLKECYYSEINK